MAISDAQLEANRRNALRSTGPRSEEGKSRSSANALKHGYFSREAFVQGEDRAEYDANIQSFLDKFQPADAIERRIVLRLADTEWRMSRARGIEAATLDLQMDETADLVEQRFESIDEATRLVYAMQLFDATQLSVFLANQRFESALGRQFARDFRLLTDLRAPRAQAA